MPGAPRNCPIRTLLVVLALIMANNLTERRSVLRAQWLGHDGLLCGVCVESDGEGAKRGQILLCAGVRVLSSQLLLSNSQQVRGPANAI